MLDFLVEQIDSIENCTAIMNLALHCEYGRAILARLHVAFGVIMQKNIHMTRFGQANLSISTLNSTYTKCFIFKCTLRTVQHKNYIKTRITFVLYSSKAILICIILLSTWS